MIKKVRQRSRERFMTRTARIVIVKTDTTKALAAASDGRQLVFLQSFRCTRLQESNDGVTKQTQRCWGPTPADTVFGPRKNT